MKDPRAQKEKSLRREMAVALQAMSEGFRGELKGMSGNPIENWARMWSRGAPALLEALEAEAGPIEPGERERLWRWVGAEMAHQMAVDGALARKFSEKAKKQGEFRGQELMRDRQSMTDLGQALIQLLQSQSAMRCQRSVMIGAEAGWGEGWPIQEGAAIEQEALWERQEWRSERLRRSFEEQGWVAEAAAMRKNQSAALARKERAILGKQAREAGARKRSPRA